MQLVEPFSFHPFPTLSTERLQLRQLRVSDELGIFALRSHKKIAEYLSRSCDTQLEQSRQFIQKINKGIQAGEWIYWGLTLTTKDQVIGTICLWNLDLPQRCAEIGYELHPDFQRRGLMQEAIEAVLAYGFQDMQLKTVEAYLHSQNKPSIQLLERNQFSFSKIVPPESKFQEEDQMEMVIYTRSNTGHRPY